MPPHSFCFVFINPSSQRIFTVRMLLIMWLLTILLGISSSVSAQQLHLYTKCMMEDTLINSDLWDEHPRIMSAGFGFADIIGCSDAPITESSALACGASWNSKLKCTVCADGSAPSPKHSKNPTKGCSQGNAPPEPPPARSMTSASTMNPLAIQLWGANFTRKGGLPVCFSWPVVMSTAATGVDFEITQVTVLANGTKTYSKVYAIGKSAYPNFERNEKHCVVITADWGQRIPSSRPGASWPVNLTILNDPVSPLMLVGPNGPVSAVGLSIDTSQANPYDRRNGPVLLAAKVSVMNITGEGGNAFQEAFCPLCSHNDGVALYGINKAQYRLRLFYSGGFTQNGVNGMRPKDYAKFFRVIAKHKNGRVIALVQTGKTYHLPEPIQVVGLAELGRKQQAYDFCYDEDKDNYIDIVLRGSKAAMRRLRTVFMPTKTFQKHKYKPVYNPGGPGFTPFKNVTYTQLSPRNSVRIQIALDNPKVVSYSSGESSSMCNSFPGGV